MADALIIPTDAETELAGSFRGKTLKVLRIDLNSFDPEAYRVMGGFAIHPNLGVSAVDEQGRQIQNGELVFVVTPNKVHA